MNFMSDVNNTTTQTQNGQPVADVQKAYEELQALYGKQSNELWQARDFIEKVNPLLTKLDEQDPVLIQAILDGTIDADLAKAVKEGKLTKTEAAAVTKATTEVKEEIKNNTAGLSDADIEKLVAEKAAKLLDEKNSEVFEKIAKLEDYSQKQEAEKMLNNFTNAHPDFDYYTEEVQAIMDKRSNKDDLTLEDLELIYDAAKARHLQKISKEGKEAELAEIAKILAGAGSSNETNGGTPSDPNDDGLFNAPPRDPNSFMNWI